MSLSDSPTAPTDEVLFTEGDFRITKLNWVTVPARLSIQHKCIKDTALGSITVPPWRIWRIYSQSFAGDPLYAASDVENTCSQCGQVPSAGLRTVYLFLLD